MAAAVSLSTGPVSEIVVSIIVSDTNVGKWGPGEYKPKFPFMSFLWFSLLVTCSFTILVAFVYNLLLNRSVALIILSGYIEMYVFRQEMLACYRVGNMS